MRRILWLLTITVAVLFVIGLGLKILHANRTGQGITPEAYEKVQIGMTEGDVVIIFGCSAGDYSREQGPSVLGPIPLPELDEPGVSEKHWETDGFRVTIKSVEGRVVGKHFAKKHYLRIDMIDLIKGWFSTVMISP